MTAGQSNPPKPDLRPFQFGLRTLLWFTVYSSVLAKVCTTLHTYWLKGLPVWLLVSFFIWTAAIVAQLAFSIWGWLWLRKMCAAECEQTGGFAGGDSPGLDKPYGHRRRFWAAFAWGMMALVLWMTFAATLVGKRSNQEWEEWMGASCLIVLHFLPLALVSHISYLFRSRGKGEAPLRAMRLCSIVGFILPVVSPLVAWTL